MQEKNSEEENDEEKIPDEPQVTEYLEEYIKDIEIQMSYAKFFICHFNHDDRCFCDNQNIEFSNKNFIGSLLEQAQYDYKLNDKKLEAREEVDETQREELDPYQEEAAI